MIKSLVGHKGQSETNLCNCQSLNDSIAQWLNISVSFFAARRILPCRRSTGWSKLDSRFNSLLPSQTKSERSRP